MVRTIFLSSAAALIAAIAVAQEPDAAPEAAAAPVALQNPPPADDAHGAGAAPAVAGVDELDALNQGAEEEYPDIEEEPVRKPVSVTVRALDKITARYKDLTAGIGETMKFGSLEITPRYCDKRPPEDFPETTAFLEVFDRDASGARAAASVEVRDIDAKAVDAKGAAAPATTMESGLPSALDPDRIFAGWMFASTPALNPLEHPVYDVWVIDCKTQAVSN
ncbi:MAG: DUF2155 domain-containing protein [Parvularculaceae bacterium]